MCSSDDHPPYERPIPKPPAIHVVSGGKDPLREAHKALGSFIWLGNNLHNSDTATFRDMYRACLQDAVTAYNATRSEGEPEAGPILDITGDPS